MHTMSKRYIFFVLGTCLFVFSPLIIIFVPAMIPMTFYFVKYTWVYYVPKEAYTVFAISLFLVVIGCFLMFFGKMRKVPTIAAIIIFLLAITAFYGSSRSYIRMADNGFTYRSIFERHTKHAGWQDVAQIERIEPPAGEVDNATYLFTLHNGEVLQLKENNHVQLARSKMRAKYSQYDIPVIYSP